MNEGKKKKTLEGFGKLRAPLGGAMDEDMATKSRLGKSPSSMKSKNMAGVSGLGKGKSGLAPRSDDFTNRQPKPLAPEANENSPAPSATSSEPTTAAASNKKRNKGPSDDERIFTAMWDEAQGQSGGRRMSYDTNGLEWRNGPLKGYNKATGYEMMRKKMAGLSPEDRKKYLDRSKFLDIQSKDKKKKKPAEQKSKPTELKDFQFALNTNKPPAKRTKAEMDNTPSITAIA